MTRPTTSFIARIPAWPVEEKSGDCQREQLATPVGIRLERRYLLVTEIVCGLVSFFVNKVVKQSGLTPTNRL